MNLTLNLGCGEETWGDIRTDISLWNWLPFGHKNCVHLLSDAHYLPFRSNIFSYIRLNSVLEFVQNPRQVLKEIYRILQDKGILYILVPTDPRNLITQILLLLQLKFWHVWNIHYKILCEGRKWRFTTESLTWLLKTCNYKIIKIWKADSQLLPSSLAKYIPIMFHPTIEVEAQK